MEGMTGLVDKVGRILLNRCSNEVGSRIGVEEGLRHINTTVM